MYGDDDRLVYNAGILIAYLYLSTMYSDTAQAGNILLGLKSM